MMYYLTNNHKNNNTKLYKQTVLKAITKKMFLFIKQEENQY